MSRLLRRICRIESGIFDVIILLTVMFILLSLAEIISSLTGAPAV